MNYILDITDPKVAKAIEELGIESNQLLIRYPLHRELPDFQGHGKLQELRYSHYEEKLEKIMMHVKNHMNSLDTSPSIRVFLTSRQTSNDFEKVKKVKALHRHYLSMHIEEETKKRERFSKTMEKLGRKENLDKKLREEIEVKKKNEEQRREALEDRIRNLLVPSKNRKHIRTISPKASERKDHNFSRMSIRLSGSVERDDVQRKLQSLNQKIDRSKELHELALKEKTAKISWHTQKVNQLLHTVLSVKDQTGIERVQQFADKIKGTEKRKEKNRNDFYEKLKKHQEVVSDKNSKIKQNQEEEFRKEKKRIDRIEEKMNTTLRNMQMKNEEVKFERELKFERAKLKEEDILENAARIKKTELNKKLKILEKHHELDKRLEYLKEEKNKMNEKTRDEAHKTVIEKLKLKDLKLMVEKTSDPTKMHKILDKFYNKPSEPITLSEEPRNDIP